MVKIALFLLFTDAIVCFIAITGVLTLLFILFFQCDYRRLRFEERVIADNIMTSHARRSVISS